MKKPPKAVPRRFAHYEDPAFGDSLLGLRMAVADGYKWADINTQVTLDGYVVCTHWSEPLKHGWYDPLNQMDRNTKVWQMTKAQVHRLRYRKDYRLRIVTISVLLRHAKLLGISIEIEAKNSPQFTTPAPWERIRRAVDRTGVTVEVKMLTLFKTWPAALKQAHDHGFKTMLLPRRSCRAPRTSWADVDCVRGFVVWTPLIAPKK